ncbi:GIY-YIG domain protein [Clostridium botulinum E1 str. 'BoNT E Beluga']|nr:GIY-YIG domain protein [Clostridium botulinum E1 str. 'BoNT E Beluga']
MYYEVFEDKKEAMRREYKIKRLTRLQKEILIKNFDCTLL